MSNRIVLCTADRLAVHGWRFNKTKIQAGENAARIVWWNTRWLPLQQYQKSIKSLPSLAARQGPDGGWERATLSFPLPTLGANWPPAPRRYSPQPAQFIRPRSRAVQRLALAEFRVRPLGSLGLVVAPPACELGQDTFVTLRPRLDLCAPGRPSLLAMRWPGATGLTSYLSGCLLFCSVAAWFVTLPH